MQEHRRRRKQEFPWLVVVIGLLVAGVFFYFTLHNRRTPTGQAQVPVPPPPPAQQQPAKPVIEHPVPPPAQTPTAPKAAPLPKLDQSDASVLNDVTDLLGEEAVQKFLVKSDIIRNIVVTVDNLPRKKIAPRVWPVHTTPGKLKVNSKDDTYTLDPDNAARYQPFMNVVKAADPKKLAAAYLRYYPLFQQAFQDLGYPHGYFNDRLVQVIDHLLKTPDITGSVRLVRPSVYYKFADPGLEGRSAGQKILMRLGSANEAIIKSKLRTFRQAIVIPQAH